VILFVNHYDVNSRRSFKRKFSSLRITGGFLKGRNIVLLQKSGVRYTSAKVREAIFNILGDMKEKRVLDLYAGSSSFTIEALSRGAMTATSVEFDRDMAEILKKNIIALNLKNSCHILTMDVAFAVPFLAKRAFSYDIIFMDPPYDKGYVGESMSLLMANRIYHTGSVIVIEHSKRETPVFAEAKGFYRMDTKGYGDTFITLFQAD